MKNYLNDILYKIVEQEDLRFCQTIADDFCKSRCCVECKMDRIVERLLTFVSSCPQYSSKNIIDFLKEILKK